MAQLVVKILSDLSKFSADMRSATEDLTNFSKSGRKAHGSVEAVSTYMAGPAVAAATAIGGGLAFAVGKAGEFEAAMSAIQAVTGATADETKQMSALALQLGADTSFSAKEAADGIGELAKGGVSIADIMGGGAAAALTLAAAGGVSVADAASLAANAMALFNIQGSETANVADKIAGFANATTGSVSDFKFALSSVGAVAKLSGQNFDDTAVAISLMGKAGILGSDAGTSLKTMLMNLQPETKKQVAVWKELGLTTDETANAFVNADGSFKSLREIAGVLHTALDGLSESQKSAALEAMFGSDAIRAGAIIAEAGADGWDAMAESMDKVTAASVAATRLDNMAGSMEALSGSVDTAAIMLGQELTPTIREAAEAGTKFLNDTIIPWIKEYGPSFGAAIRDGAHAGGDLLLALAPLWEVAGPMLRKTVDDWGQGIDRTIDSFYQLVVGAVNLKNGVGEAFNEAGTFVHDAVEGMATFTVDRWNDIQTGVGQAQDGIHTKITDVWNAIPEDIRTDLGKIGTALSTKTADFLVDTQKWLTGTQTSTDTSWTATSGTVTSKTGEIGTTIGNAFSELGTKTRGWWDAVERAVSGPLTTAYTSVTTFVSNVGTALTGLATTMKTEAIAIGTGIIDGMKQGLANGVQSIKDTAGNVARSALTSAMNVLGEHSPSSEFRTVGEFAIQGLILGLQAKKDELMTAAGAIAAGTIAAFAPLREPLGPMAKEGKWADFAGQTAGGSAPAVQPPGGQSGQIGTYGLRPWGGISSLYHEVQEGATETADVVEEQTTRITRAWGGVADLGRAWSGQYVEVGEAVEEATHKTGPFADAIAHLNDEEDTSITKTGRWADLVAQLGTNAEDSARKGNAFGTWVQSLGEDSADLSGELQVARFNTDQLDLSMGSLRDTAAGLGPALQGVAGGIGNVSQAAAQGAVFAASFNANVSQIGGGSGLASQNIPNGPNYQATSGSAGQNNSYGGGAGGGAGTGLGNLHDMSSTPWYPGPGTYLPSWQGTAMQGHNFQLPPAPPGWPGWIPWYPGAILPPGVGLQHFANGAVVMGETLARIGEAGPEAVMPLDYLQGMVESVAATAAAGGSQPIQINVYHPSGNIEFERSVVTALRDARGRGTKI